MKFRLASLVNDSIVDGPGFRLTVFVQGCPHHCPGCHNPQTHDPAGGRDADTDWVLEKAAENPLLSGITLSGGEPFAQPEAMAALARGAKEQGLHVMAYSGYMSQNGTQEQPMNPGPYAGDYFNSLMIVSSTLAALHKANRTGKGESIDLAMYETLLAIGQYYLVDYLNEGILWPRPGARNQNLCGIGEYKCNDGFLGVCLYGVDQNKYFLETIGLGHLWGTEDIPEDTSGLWLANPHAAEIEAAFEAYCLEHSKYEIEADFAAHRIAAQVVMEFEDLVKEDHLKLREDFMDWETEDGKTFKGLGVFPKFQQTPGQVWRPMPKQGGDTADVLTKLGYTADQIAALNESGVVKVAE